MTENRNAAGNSALAVEVQNAHAVATVTGQKAADAAERALRAVNVTLAVHASPALRSSATRLRLAANELSEAALLLALEASRFELVAAIGALRAAGMTGA